MNWIIITLFVSVLTKYCQTAIVTTNDSKDFELLILHNNDMHARFEQTSALSSTCSKQDANKNLCYGGFARVAHSVREFRKKEANGTSPPVLYLNAGDTYTGTVWFTVYKWEIAAAFVNMLKPDAVSLGNHEFDNGVSGLTPFIENLTCPVLCANINLRNEPTLEREPNLMKFTILEKNNRKIGIIGYLTPDTKQLVSPNNVEYENEIPAIKRVAQNLKKDGINIIIALGHSGFETDKQIAMEVEEVDLVIGGHTNTFLWNGKVPDHEESQGPYPTEVIQASGKKVPVVQAYAYTKYLGRLHLVFNSEGDLIRYDGQPILLDHTTPQDPDVLELLEIFRPGIELLVQHVVGTSKVLLGGSQSACRIGECNIGNLFTDAMIYNHLLDYTGDGWTDAPIAILQGGGIRSSIESDDANGNITRADIMQALPFDNAIVAIQITGKTLLSALERSVENYDLIEAPGSFLQYSGIIVYYDLFKPPGSRVVEAYARCGQCDIPIYSNITDDEIYKILVPQFLYNGGDGYTMFRDNLTSPGVILSFNDVETVVKYLEDKSPVYPEIGGRITFLPEEKNSAIALMTSPYILINLILIQFFYQLIY